jgi:GT2 family glycosyltransferase
LKHSLDILIVNWNSDNFLRNCLNSITRSDRSGIDLRLIIVDNGSTDRSLEDLPESLNLKLIKNSHNRGFAAACNQAWKISDAGYLLLMNPDTEVYKNTLHHALLFMESHKDIAVLGCRHVDRDGQTVPSCSRFPKFSNYFYKIFGLTTLFPKKFVSPDVMYEWDHETSNEVDQVMGAFMLIRYQTLQKVGGLDERFFLYFEDLDISNRIKGLGGKIYYNAEIIIYHQGGGTSQKVLARRLSYSLHSRILYSFKYFSLINAIFLSILTLFIEPLTRLIFTLIHGQFSQCKEIIKGYFYLCQILLEIKKT